MMVKGRTYTRPTIALLTQAIQNRVLIDLVHNTDGSIRTERAIAPMYLAYGRGGFRRFVYLRAQHVGGQSASNAPPNTQRLFKMRNMISIKQSGSYYWFVPPTYRDPDRGLGRKIAAIT